MDSALLSHSAPRPHHTSAELQCVSYHTFAVMEAAPAQDLTLEQKAAALRKAHPAYAAAEVEAALLAHGGDINATAAALVLGADARAEVCGPAVIICGCSCQEGDGLPLSAAGPLGLTCAG